MRIVSAALSARTPLSVACAAVFVGQPTWADESTTDRATPDTSVSHSSVTNDSANSLTDSANTLQAIKVTAARAAPAFETDTPGVVETVTREQIDARNIVNTEDALKYEPNLMVRKRFTGDRNSVFAGRDFNELQSARGLVYADGLLLSILLGSSYAYPPRWALIAPDDIAQVEVLYGPFSALYPGNSIGSTVQITTRKPEKLEASLDTQLFTQHYDDPYGLTQNFGGNHESARIAYRVSRIAYRVSRRPLLVFPDPRPP
jgi:iron complex outermembrane receptor protein